MCSAGSRKLYHNFVFWRFNFFFFLRISLEGGSGLLNLIPTMSLFSVYTTCWVSLTLPEKITLYNCYPVLLLSYIITGHRRPDITVPVDWA